MALYRFDSNVYYCDISGIFEISEEELLKLYGRTVYFSEECGKHSEVIVTLSEGMFTRLTDDKKFIEDAHTYGILPVGFDPRDYLQCEECGCGEYDCECEEEEEDNG